MIAGSWEYTDLKSQPPEAERKKPLEKAVILRCNTDDSRRALANGQAIGAGQGLAADWPRCWKICTPEFLAADGHRHSEASRNGHHRTRRREMKPRDGILPGGRAGNSPGSEADRAGVQGRKGERQTVVLVGKGLCFDSGGISIKPAQGMEFMKFDMCGAAGVLGTFEAIGQMKPEVNVVGIVGATTNMPGGTAMNPGDVVKAQNGKSIEIINTDAEGRLVLADCLSYAKRFEPDVVIARQRSPARASSRWVTRQAACSRRTTRDRGILAAGKRAGELPGRFRCGEYKDSSSPTSPTSRILAAGRQGRSPRRCSLRNLPKGIRGLTSTLPALRTPRPIWLRFPRDRRACHWVPSSSSFGGEFAERNIRAVV